MLRRQGSKFPFVASNIAPALYGQCAERTTINLPILTCQQFLFTISFGNYFFISRFHNFVCLAEGWEPTVHVLKKNYEYEYFMITTDQHSTSCSL